jgi:hypothetical protein
MNKKAKKKEVCKNFSCNNSGSAVYGLGVIGSAIYYISSANGFWMGVLGLLKSLVWPTFLVYNTFKFLLGE